MTLWLLRPIDPGANTGPWEPWYDKAFGFVVRAETEEAARAAITEGDAGDEWNPHGNPWLDPALASCVELTPDGEPGVVIRDMRDA